ncbi:hypothetical protein RvY_19202 [Ramazzottius varieornatus]|uniref:Uncharacterized protein n=1 Tax=Ramazzottius varieornatus TaxID=947166 RepID=A0A1D1WC51_RAMVA|nr:hypothetical protein RvY_19202 [Ramazzottius varieornatus]
MLSMEMEVDSLGLGIPIGIQLRTQGLSGGDSEEKAELIMTLNANPLICRVALDSPASAGLTGYPQFEGWHFPNFRIWRTAKPPIIQKRTILPFGSGNLLSLQRAPKGRAVGFLRRILVSRADQKDPRLAGRTAVRQTVYATKRQPCNSFVARSPERIPSLKIGVFESGFVKVVGQTGRNIIFLLDGGFENARVGFGLSNRAVWSCTTSENWVRAPSYSFRSACHDERAIWTVTTTQHYTMFCNQTFARGARQNFILPDQ